MKKSWQIPFDILKQHPQENMVIFIHVLAIVRMWEVVLNPALYKPHPYGFPHSQDKRMSKKKKFFFVVISPMFIKYVHPPKTCMKLWHAIWNWKYQYLAKNKPEVLVVAFVVKAPPLSSLFIATFAQARENEIYLVDLYWDLPYQSCTNLPCP